MMRTIHENADECNHDENNRQYGVQRTLRDRNRYSSSSHSCQEHYLALANVQVMTAECTDGNSPFRAEKAIDPAPDKCSHHLCHGIGT